MSEIKISELFNRPEPPEGLIPLLPNQELYVNHSKLEGDGGYCNMAAGMRIFGEVDIDLKGCRKDAAALEGKEIVFGFRPEAIVLQPQEGAIRVDCQVELTEMLGDNTNVYITSGEQQAILKVDSHDTPEMDAPLTFYIPREAIYLFDGETELAIRQD